MLPPRAFSCGRGHRLGGRAPLARCAPAGSAAAHCRKGRAPSPPPLVIIFRRSQSRARRDRKCPAHRARCNVALDPGARCVFAPTAIRFNWIMRRCAAVGLGRETSRAECNRARLMALSMPRTAPIRAAKRSVGFYFLTLRNDAATFSLTPQNCPLVFTAPADCVLSCSYWKHSELN